MNTTLQADGPSGRFLVNGKPTFLLGASYYGGLALEPAETEPDLRELRGLGFNWVRLWCTWGAFGNDVAAMDDQGKAREPYLSRLVGFCALADRLGMIVDVTFSRGLPPDHAAKAPWLRSPLQTRPAYLEALRTVTDALRAYRNVYIDVVNERNTHRMPPVPFDQAAEMISLVRRIDPGRLVTISDVYDIPDAEVAGYIQIAGVDFLTPHRVRTAESPAQTAENTRRYRRLAAETGRPVPVHYQEPFRRDFTTWQPTAEDFLTDLAGAVEGGAAGWCFHNGFSRHSPDSRPRRSFDLRDGRLMEQLDDVERAVVNRCAALTPSWT